MLWVLLLVLAFLSYKVSHWFIIGLLVVFFWKFYIWRLHNSRPWRKVHFKMMVNYSRAMGLETIAAENEGREFNTINCLRFFLNDVNPKLNISYPALIEREIERFKNFYDEPLIRNYLETKKYSKTVIDDFLIEMKDNFKNIELDDWIMIRMVIACLIEEKYSSIDRGEYMYEVFTNSNKAY